MGQDYSDTEEKISMFIYLTSTGGFYYIFC